MHFLFASNFRVFLVCIKLPCIFLFASHYCVFLVCIKLPCISCLHRTSVYFLFASNFRVFLLCIKLPCISCLHQTSVYFLFASNFRVFLVCIKLLCISCFAMTLRKSILCSSYSSSSKRDSTVYCYLFSIPVNEALIQLLRYFIYYLENQERITAYTLYFFSR